jgi:CxxC motif-containing protein (DUF1111 family)
MPKALLGLSGDMESFFSNAMADFMEVDSVSGNLPGEKGAGLGPTFNGNSCAQCHASPVVGGSSPAKNPQVELATLDGALNTVPSFITDTGPVREVRFVRNPDGSPDGGVHGLFTIRGRMDASGCDLRQPNFAQQLAAGNVIFRIPTPTFGLGLVEATPDSTLQANVAANRQIKSQLGINGILNTSGNDGTVTRFGWKAQNKSLMVFSGEAYNVEQGVSNEAFVNERAGVAGCVYNGSPEDATKMLNDDNGTDSGTAQQMSSDLINFAAFMRLSAPPAPAPMSNSAANGAKLFNSVGCGLCHTSTLTTGMSKFAGMSTVTYHPFSDFAVHHMGSGLADGVSQGAAGPDQFRTAPLWGLGQRLFFLHDGRTSDLLQAIQAHASDCGNGRFRSRGNADQGCGSEANDVVRRFNSLNRSQMQDVLNFLRSL